jgi:hypothetical protein
MPDHMQNSNQRLRITVAFVLSGGLAAVYGGIFAAPGDVLLGVAIGLLVFVSSTLVSFYASGTKQSAVQKYASKLAIGSLQTKATAELLQETNQASFLFGGSYAAASDDTVVEGVYQQLTYNLGEFRAKNAPRSSAYISFVRIKLPHDYPVVLADGLENTILFTKAKRAAQLQWFEPSPAQLVLVRADPVLESSLGDVLPLELLQTVSGITKRFNIEILGSELFIYVDTQKPEVLHGLARKSIDILTGNNIQTIIPLQPSVTLPKQQIFTGNGAYILRAFAFLLFLFTTLALIIGVWVSL